VFQPRGRKLGPGSYSQKLVTARKGRAAYRGGVLASTAESAVHRAGDHQCCGSRVRIRLFAGGTGFELAVPLSVVTRSSRYGPAQKPVLASGGTFPYGRTDGSNPLPSSGESENHRSPVGRRLPKRLHICGRPLTPHGSSDEPECDIPCQCDDHEAKNSHSDSFTTCGASLLDSTIIAIIGMSQSSWLVASMLPGIERQPRKKLEPSPERLLALLHRWQDEAVRAGCTITRTALAFEAGRDGFWLARWLAARGMAHAEGQAQRGVIGRPRFQAVQGLVKASNRRRSRHR
jgi:hypothetical protein